MNNAIVAILNRPAPAEELNRTQLANPAGVQAAEASPLVEMAALQPALPEHGDNLNDNGKLIKSILVPTDFSHASSQAIQRAVAIANQCHATVTLLHVIDINAQAPPKCFANGRDYAGPLWSESLVKLGRLASSLCGQVEARTALQEGLPWEEIVERSRDFDLVLLGESRSRRHRNLFSRHTVGAVLAHSACPVLVVPDGD